MDAIKGFLAPLHLNTSSIKHALKLVVIGGTVETARRASASAWNGFVDSFYITAHFSREDYPLGRLMHWLSKQPGWIRSREFEIATCTVGQGQSNQSITRDLGDGDIDEEGVRPMEDSHNERKVTFKPSPGITHTVFYRDHWLKITPIRSNQDFGNYSALEISVIAHKNDILKRLVLEAKREYEKDAEYQVHIFTADAQHGCWRWNGRRPKRPMSSIVLEPAVKEMLLADCRDFLRSEDCGKTSLINSLAGELGLDICVLILSSKGCILLLEDLDAAFTSDITSTTDTTANTNGGSALSLSDLLASLDWIDPGEGRGGRLVFVTTNHVERLDPALSRPGRMDVWVNFAHATKWQAEQLFKLFFIPPRPSGPSSNESPPLGAPRENFTRAGRGASAHAVPVLEDEDIVQLAQRFANAIPEGEMSVWPFFP
ncbi:BCS1 N terminal-domain-containing protein [Russula aff. rugulosa BPL654]|nr:BCS1 N terminal-domain-containing protein [Russula aff. rugulosa BPL654]